MKKTLLSLAFALLAGTLLASAQSESDGYQLRFCQDVDTWVSLTTATNVTYTCYLYISPDIATQLAGNKLTDVNFSARIGSSTAGLDGTGFVSEDIKSDPIISKVTKITNCRVGDEALIETITFDEPYVIKEGVGFYFGYTVKGCKVDKDYPLAIDNTAGGSYSGSVNIKSMAGADRGTYDVGTRTGANMVIYANTVGEKQGVENVFSIGNVSFPTFAMSIIDIADGYDIKLPIYNYGSNDITSVTYETVVNGGAPTLNTLEVNVPSKSDSKVELPIQGLIAGNNSFSFRLKNINGIDINMKALMTSFLGIENGYDRKFVVEEGTGTWCGWCPRGIVGMEKMAELYPDKFIGIAVHSGDEFAVNSYKAFIDKYFEGFPSCVINRDPNYLADPDFDMLNMLYSDYWNTQSTFGEVVIKVNRITGAKNRLSIDATSRFAISNSSANYAIAFVLIEDGLEGAQSNYYAGGARGPMGGWENKGSTVQWTYLDTARGIYTVWGANNSVPKVIEARTDYPFHYDMLFTNVKDIEQTSVVALLLDKKSGVILNAAKVKAADYGEIDGITDITMDDDAEAEYYNLQGVRMPADNLPSGMYIVRKGNEVTKVVK